MNGSADTEAQQYGAWLQQEERADRAEAALARVSDRDALEAAIKVGIGYDPVPLSVRGHPEIRLEHRTLADRDGLVERITLAVLALMGGAA